MIIVYAQVPILTSTHLNYTISDEVNKGASLRSTAFLLDRLYTESGKDEQTEKARLAILDSIESEFANAKTKIMLALDDVKAQFSDTGKDMPAYGIEIAEYLDALPETRRVEPGLMFDVIWDKVLIWRLVELFSLSEYLTILAFYGKTIGAVTPKSFRDFHKAMMFRPLKHAFVSVRDALNRSEFTLD